MLHFVFIFLMSQIPSCRIFRPSRVHHFAAPDGEHGDVFLADGLGAGGSPHYHPYPNRPQHRLPPILAHFAPSGSLCRRATTPAGPPGMEHNTKSNFIQITFSRACLSEQFCLLLTEYWSVRGSNLVLPQLLQCFHLQSFASDLCTVRATSWNFSREFL